jgi:putative ABC transport system permease protein
MARIWRGLKLGMKSLLLHKLRSGLTVLGIVFGVAAVISMLAVGEGSSRDAQKKIQELGATNIIVKSVKPTDEAQTTAGGRGRSILNYGLKYEDFDRIMEAVPTITRALPIREIRKQIRHLDKSIDGRIVGTTQDYAEFNHLEMARGRFLKQADIEKTMNYAVLAHETATKLFPLEDPIGLSVKLSGDYYTVVGVTRERGGTAAIGGSLASQEYDKDVYIPLTTCRLRFGDKIMNSRTGSMEAEETQLSQITLQVGSIDEVKPSHPIIEAAVNGTSDKPFHPKKDIQIVVPYDLLLAAQQSARTFSIILGSIAGISLVVGGIGIMNIMLATVTERTREIGIRRALGAKQRDIRQQFLIETVVLSGLGGVLGVCLGFSIPRVIIFFFPDTKAIVTTQSVLLAFGISVMVGIFFGMYPAVRAAKMDPIEALRHE